MTLQRKFFIIMQGVCNLIITVVKALLLIRICIDVIAKCQVLSASFSEPWFIGKD